MKIFSKDSFNKLRNSLTKTRNNFVNKLNEIIIGKVDIDENFFDELEETLISADIGREVAEKILADARKNINKIDDKSIETLKSCIKNSLENILSVENNELLLNFISKPYVILFFGSNGSGKTTTIAKLAYKLKAEDKRILIASGDTFRAAAHDQLKIWADSVAVDLIESDSRDASAVVYDAITKAVNEKYDIVLIDTAGRLQNNKNLMLELSKIQKVISNLLPNAPHESLLVIESNMGQNAVIQAKDFSKYLNISGLVLTKLDGTAKGGVVFQICSEKNIPIRYIGTGEGIEDLDLFNAEMFIEALF
jgi:fused signal recognition particle receptor